jgi:tRNA nucleotidyltransferase (CCA-adding enzyme)
MQIYLVGGAIRDGLLGRPVEERDFVVVGATPDMMLALGYRLVGRDFPIFLHPKTKEEYALARSRRESASEGHPQTDPDPSVTLEQDLARRDLTINAIAQNQRGELVDPFGGRDDLRERVLRHVSPAFADDPVRVLRVARFMARYSALGFKVADETMSLMREMAEEGRLDSLVPERIWQELSGALGEADPRHFFDTLRACGALCRILPEIDSLYGVPQPTHWHPEVDCGVHTMLALGVACQLSDSIDVRFATLTHDLGKATTPEPILPSHHGHEGRGERLVEALCDRLKVPNRYRDLATMCAVYHGYTHRIYELRAKTVVKLLMGLDAFRRPERLEQFLLVCEADYRGREGFDERPYPQAADLRRLFESARDVRLSAKEASGDGRLRGEAIRRARVKRVAVRFETMRRSTCEPVEDAEAGDIGANGGTQCTEDKD